MAKKTLTYNPKNTIIGIAGVTITHFGEDDMITVERNEEPNMARVDVLGNVGRTVNADKTATLTISQSANSPFFSFLMDLADREDNFDVNVEDLNENQPNITATDCFVTGVADITKGKEIEDVEFEIFLSYHTTS